MRHLRIGVFVLFILSCILNVGANFYYNKNHDSTMPEISSDQDALELSINSSDEELLAGLKAQDKKDGDLTDQIMIAGKSYFIEPGTCNVQYVVFDSDHNSATLTRRVHYTDYTSPKFVVTEPLVFQKGKNISFLEQVGAQDVLDGDISEKIRVKYSNVSNYEAGAYPVQLEVSNSYGDTVTVELTVLVTGAQTELSVRLKEYVTYVKQGEMFDPYSLIDSAVTMDGNSLSASDVHITGNVDTGQAGCYQLVYYVDGSSEDDKTYLTVVVTGEGE